MIIGFTGSRHGMNSAQVPQLHYFFQALIRGDGIGILHYGYCVGADAEVHNHAIHVGLNIDIHPPKDVNLRAWCSPSTAHLEAEDYLTRNKAIVDACDMLIAAPYQGKEQPCGGLCTCADIEDGHRFVRARTYF